jgi:hypothetical protein
MRHYHCEKNERVTSAFSQGIGRGFLQILSHADAPSVPQKAWCSSADEHQVEKRN